MITATFNLPTVDNAGHAIDGIHSDLESVLCDRFGGATVSDATGLWKHDGKVYREPVRSYHVAIDDDDADEFRSIAKAWGALADQLAVYVEIGNRPEIIELAPAIAAE